MGAFSEIFIFCFFFFLEAIIKKDNFYELFYTIFAYYFKRGKVYPLQVFIFPFLLYFSFFFFLLRNVTFNKIFYLLLKKFTLKLKHNNNNIIFWKNIFFQISEFNLKSLNPCLFIAEPTLTSSNAHQSELRLYVSFSYPGLRDNQIGFIFMELAVWSLSNLMIISFRK